LNIPNAVFMGYELEGEYRLEPVTLKFGLSEVFAENDDSGAYLSNNTPMTFVADASYSIRQFDSVVGWRTRMADKSDRGSSSLTRTDGYAVHDLYARWTPEQAVGREMTVDLGIENLFDTAYTKRYASLFEEGRSYVAKVSMKW
jgi:hemoglobin/transferrin/lactoferrin receptor protein